MVTRPPNNQVTAGPGGPLVPQLETQMTPAISEQSEEWMSARAALA